MESHPGCSGRLAPVVEARVADPGGDGTGELLVRSPAGMDGYWGLPGDPTISADGWISTGDIGRVDGDGYVYITGRSKEIIIRGGENVSASAVEAALAGHPAIAEAAVVGLPDPDLGEIVAAAIILADDAAPSVEELDRWARDNLAHFAVPARWWIRSGTADERRREGPQARADRRVARTPGRHSTAALIRAPDLPARSRALVDTKVEFSSYMFNGLTERRDVGFRRAGGRGAGG